MKRIFLTLFLTFALAASCFAADKTLFQFGVYKVVPKTCQTTSYQTGDDGDYEKGNPASPRFVDNSDGTISDKATGITWTKDPAKIYPGGSGELSSSKSYWQEDMGSLSVGDLVSTNWPAWTEGASVQYVANKIVKSGFDGAWYKCALTHYANSKQPITDTGYGDYWSQVTDWQDSTYYALDAIVEDNQEFGMYKVYKCIQAHTSNAANDRPGSGTNWADYWVYEVEWPSPWAADTGYTTSSYVQGTTMKIYKCTSAHTSWPHEPNVDTDWATYWETKSKPANWASSTSYTAGDRKTDSMSGYVYICKDSHYSNNKQPGVDTGWATYWTDVSAQYPAWVVSTEYGIGDKVSSWMSLYNCKLAHTSSSDDEPGMGPNWSTYWTLLSVNSWSQGTYYAVDALVNEFGTVYKCTKAHYANQGQPNMDTGWQQWWKPDYTGYVVNSAHTAASDKEPPNASYFTPTPFNTGASLTSVRAMCWIDSIEEIEALTWNSKTDWRMPNINELATIADYSQTSPINATYFPNTQTNYYWSSTTRKQDTSHAKCFDFSNNGEVKNSTKTDVTTRYVRLVRTDW